MTSPSQRLPGATSSHEPENKASGAATVLAGEAVELLPAVEAATLLRADHELLDEVSGRVLDTIEEGDREDVGAAITEMQLRIRAHLDGEERELLPEYARHDPEDAAQVLAEHAAIRELLAELDVATDLHLIRLEGVREILRRLRAHAKHENEGLYRWAAHREDAH